MRNWKCMKLQGSMTVFFCLTLLLTGALICTCLESARTAGLRFMAKTASDSALQSVFADYHGQLWEDYHVFFHYEQDDLTDSVKSYLEYYEDPAKDLYGVQDHSDLWGMTVDGVSLCEKKTAVFDGGRLFLEQAVEYEKYQIAETLLEMLLDQAGILDEIDKIRSFAIKFSEAFELIQKISTLYQDVRDGINQVGELGDQIKESFDDGNLELKEVYELLRRFADKAAWLGQLAGTYLKSSGEIGKLAAELAAEYGASEETIYGQQIRQLRAFAIDGLLGSAIGGVENRADGLLTQLCSVMEDIEQFESEARHAATGEENGESNEAETGTEESRESAGTEESTEARENSETENVRQERQAALYEKASGVIGSGILCMQELEISLDTAEKGGSGADSYDEDGSGSGSDSSDTDTHERGTTEDGANSGTDGSEEAEIDEDAGESLLALVRQWKNMAVLSLVMGKSALQTRDDSFSEGFLLPSETADKTLSEVTAAEKGLFIFYITDTFTNALSDSQKNYAYQQEYIVFGKNDSRSNLTAMAERLLAVREGLNLAYLLTNNQMRTIAETAAYALVGGTGLYPLVLVTQFVILAAWAFAESVIDVQALFRGDSVSLWKTENTWRTSISGLVSESIALVGEGTGAVIDEPGSFKEGMALITGENWLNLKFSYNDYMRLFLLIKDTQTLCLRSMDIIQEEIGSSEAGFLMSDCYGAAKVTVDFSAQYRLITLPLVGAAQSGHQIQTISSYQYQ